MELSIMENHSHDYRPLFKQYMGSGYFRKKAKDLRISRQTLSNILGGKTQNTKVLDDCLSELKEKMDTRAAALRRVKELTKIHKQLQGI